MITKRRYVNGQLVEFTIGGVEQPITAEMHRYVEKSRPTHDWPLLLRPMKLLAKPSDKGLGDIVERTIGPVGGDAYKLWYKATFGRDCGCTKRRDNLNIRYPL
jgi:hypothetical protein